MGIIPIYRFIGYFGKKVLTKKLLKLGFPKKPIIWGLKKFLEFLIEIFSGLKMSSAGKVTEWKTENENHVQISTESTNLLLYH